MHISDGILTETLAGQAVLASGTALAVAGTAIGLKKMDYEAVPKVAVLTAAFFVASLVHIRIGPSSAHLLLVGLIGLVLGWAAVPAFVVALFLQAIFFGHGGLTTLGINTFNFALAALSCYYILSTPLRRASSGGRALALGAIAGAGGILLAAALLAAELLAIGRQFELVAGAVFLAQLPVAAIEGVVTAAAVVFLRQVRPELLGPAGQIDTGE